MLPSFFPSQFWPVDFWPDLPEPFDVPTSFFLLGFWPTGFWPALSSVVVTPVARVFAIEAESRVFAIPGAQ